MEKYTHNGVEVDERWEHIKIIDWLDEIEIEIGINFNKSKNDGEIVIGFVYYLNSHVAFLKN